MNEILGILQLRDHKFGVFLPAVN